MSGYYTGTDRQAELENARELATNTSDIRHLSADMDTMVATMKTMQKTLTDINVTLSEAKGGWRVLMIMGGAAGAIGAGVVQVVHWWSK